MTSPLDPVPKFSPALHDAATLTFDLELL